MDIVTMENVTKVYGEGDARVWGLHDVSLTIEKGEIVAVVGASGSGKSTLLHVMGGVDSPNSGKVIVDGKEITKMNDDEMAVFRRRKVGFIFQAYYLIPVLSVEENITMPILLDHRKATYWASFLDSNGEIQKRMVGSNSCITCYGYDEEDYARLEEGLISGTTDLSENGILLVNGIITEAMFTDYEGAGTEFIKKEITTYEVGDTIDIVNMQRLRQLVLEEIDEAEAEALEALAAGEIESTDGYYSASEIEYDCWQQLIDEGDYKTYTIEGILEYDANHINDTGFINIVLPLDKYFELTGTDESMVYGMQYHIDDVSEEISDEWSDIVCEIDDSMPSIAYYMEASDYLFYISLANEYSGILLVALLLAIFIFLMNILNIFNTTAGNLYLRRREFAQLRVLGVSKNGLMKMVMLEGVIACLFADITGVAAGIAMGYWISYYFYMLVGVTFSVMWLPVIIVCAASLLLLLSASYFPMKRMQPELAADLTASGE